MNNSENNGFQYNYSAKERAELKKIREKYVSGTTSHNLDKMQRIKQLDAMVNKRATVISLIFGIVGTLIMGFGMSLIMTDFKMILGAYADMAFVIGISVGFIGMILVLLAYPLYHRVITSERKKIAPEIIRLTDELMADNK